MDTVNASQAPELERRSLGNVHASVGIDEAAPLWRRWASFIGPGFIVAVGYMDPGNWATDLAAGSAYGYRLLAVVLLASLMGMVLQGFSAWLGLAGERDLAQATRAAMRPAWAFLFWLFAQVAIIACDVAEVIGGAIALNLLFGLPLIAGAVLTILDAFLVLLLLRRGMRLLEAAVTGICLVIAASLLLEIALAHPALAPIAGGLLPRRDLIGNAGMLYLGVGIIGATVMPHNLYLHSALVQTRRVRPGGAARAQAVRYAVVGSCLTLGFAFLVNAAILIMAGSVFHAHGRTGVQDLGQAFSLLSPILGSRFAAIVFGVALLFSGINATVTGTLAGQVVTEGMLDLKLPAAVRRLYTRLLAVVPVILVLALAGRGAANQLLVLSQVVLSLQLPFAMLPLMVFVSRLERLRPGRAALALGWGASLLVLVFDAALVASLA